MGVTQKHVLHRLSFISPSTLHLFLPLLLSLLLFALGLLNDLAQATEQSQSFTHRSLFSLLCISFPLLHMKQVTTYCIEIRVVYGALVVASPSGPPQHGFPLDHPDGAIPLSR